MVRKGLRVEEARLLLLPLRKEMWLIHGFQFCEVMSYVVQV